MKTRNICLVLLALLATGQVALSQTNAPDFVWAQRAGGTSVDAGDGMAVDGAGNCYVTGCLHGTAQFGSITLTSSGGFDIFVAKYDSAGNVLWAKRAGGTGEDYGYGVAVDGAGNCYITGEFYGTAQFGSITLTSSGGPDIFVAKYDSAGNVLWAERAGGDVGYGVAVDGAGNCYVTGCFYGTAQFGSITLTSSGDYDIFVAKYDSAGNVLWAKRAGGTSWDWSCGVAVDGAGNCYVTGYFSGTAQFGSITLTSSGDYDIFVAKYDSAGNVLWAKRAGGTSGDCGWGYGVAVDGSGNCYVTGCFYGTAQFGSITLTSSSGHEDIFVAKYNSAGNVLWAKRAGGTDEESGNGVAVDGLGNCYATGYFWGTANFGSITLTSSGIRDIFVAKYDSAGNVLWAKRAGGTSVDVGDGVAVDGAGNCYVTGYFSGTAQFGSITLASSGDDIFVAKVADVNSISDLRLTLVQQRAGTQLVDFTYDLIGTGGSPLSLSLAYSVDGGAIWTNTSVSASTAGGYSQHLTWNAGADWPNGLTQQAKVRLCVAGTATCAESAIFPLDTRPGNGLACEWLSPASGASFKLASPIPVSVRITSVPGNQPALNAGVQVKLFLPNSTSYYTAYLKDDGVAGNDQVAGDGIYSGMLAAPTLLAPGTYALDLYAGFPKWMNDPRFVRSQQLITIGGTPAGVSPLELTLSSDAMDPFLIGHGITATVTVNCVIDEIAPGTTQVTLKIIPPTGAAVRIPLDRTGPASLTWTSATPFTPTIPGEYTFIADVTGFASLEPSASEPQKQHVYRGIGQLEHWFTHPTGLQWEPFHLGVIATTASGGGPIAAVKVTGAMTGPMETVIGFPPTSSGGSAELDFVPAKPGTYAITYRTEHNEYYFPNEPTASFTIAANTPEVKAALNTMADQAIRGSLRLHAAAGENAMDAEYLMPFVCEESKQTDFVTELTINLIGQGCAEVAGQFIRRVPIGDWLHLPGLEKGVAHWTPLKDTAGWTGSILDYYGEPVRKIVLDNGTTAALRSANVHLWEAVAGEVGVEYFVRPHITARDEETASDELGAHFYEKLQNFEANELSDDVIWGDYAQQFNQTMDNINALKSFADGHFQPVPSELTDRLLRDLDLRGKWALSCAEEFEATTDFIHNVRDDREAYEQSWWKIIDQVKWIAADIVAAHLIPGGSFLVATVEAKFESDVAQELFRVEGGAASAACSTLVGAAGYNQGIEFNTFVGTMMTLAAGNTAGVSIDPPPDGSLTCSLNAELLAEVQLPCQFPCLNPQTVRIYRRWADVVISNTGTVPAVFHVSARRHHDGAMRVDHSYTEPLLLQPGQSHGISLPLDPGPGVVAAWDANALTDLDGKWVDFVLWAVTDQGAYYVTTSTKPFRFNVTGGTPQGAIALAQQEEGQSFLAWPLSAYTRTTSNGAAAVVRFVLSNPFSEARSMVLVQPVAPVFAVASFGEGTVTETSVVWRTSLEHGQTASFELTLSLLESSGYPTVLSNTVLSVSDPGTGSNIIFGLPPIALPKLTPVEGTMTNLPFEFVRGQSYNLEAIWKNLLPVTLVTTVQVTVADLDTGANLESVQWSAENLPPSATQTGAFGYLPGSQTNVVFTVSLPSDPSNTLYTTVRTIVKDTDGDGMPDYWEQANGLNATNATDAAIDSDGDGLTNLQEYSIHTGPMKADTDDDGLNDAMELALGTNPLRADSDRDSISDGWEVSLGLDPLVKDASNDADGDGQTDVAEWFAGTNPTDSSSCLRITSVEQIGADIRISFPTVAGVVYRIERSSSVGMSNPVTVADNIDGTGGVCQVTDSNATLLPQAFYRVKVLLEISDSDNDGLSNAFEAFVSHTKLSDADTDDDGMPDGWELAFLLDPLAADASLDSDGDGMTNLKEYLAGTDPTDNASAFRIVSVGREGDDIRVTWSAVGGKTNAVQVASVLTGIYSNVSPNIVIIGTGDTTTNYLDLGAVTNWPACFYRIKLITP